jgi:hypothetical protein
MERGNALMERGNQLMAENTRAFQELRDVLGEQVQAFRLLTAEIGALIREMKEEMGAQRQALFRILDELD